MITFKQFLDEAKVVHRRVDGYPISGNDYALQALWNYAIPNLVNKLGIPPTKIKSTADVSWKLADGGSLTIMYGPINKDDNPEFVKKLVGPVVKKELEKFFAEVTDIEQLIKHNPTKRGVDATVIHFRYRVKFPDSWKKVASY